MSINPMDWAAKARIKRKFKPGLTDWFDGTTKPSRPGWYERFFTDGSVMQIWDGSFWRNANGFLHWRQVGDYPAWRGLAKQHKESTP